MIPDIYKTKFDLKCKCGKEAEGKILSPAFSEWFYECICGRTWHPELIDKADCAFRLAPDNCITESGKLLCEQLQEELDRLEAENKRLNELATAEALKIKQLQAELKTKDEEIDQLKRGYQGQKEELAETKKAYDQIADSMARYDKRHLEGLVKRLRDEVKALKGETDAGT